MLMATNNIDPNKIEKQKFSQIKEELKTTSLKQDLDKLQEFPLFANGSANKIDHFPFWLGHCPTRKVRGRSKLIRLILNKSPRPWEELIKALESGQNNNKIHKLWTKIAQTLTESKAEPNKKLGARFQACINTRNKTKTTSSIV